MDVRTALLIAGALHLGFQLVVTVVVYPTLLETAPEAWDRVHAAHSRRISWVVGPLYAIVAGVCLTTLAIGPRGAAELISIAGHALAAAATAFVAAGTHGQLGREGPQARLLARLRRADQIRLLGAALALTGAVAAVS